MPLQQRQGLNGEIMSMAAWKRWRIVYTLGFICTWLLFTRWFVNYYTVATFWRTLVFLHCCFLICAFVTFFYAYANCEHLTDLLLASLNTLVTFVYAYGMVRTYASRPAVGMVALAYAGLFFGMAGLLHQRRPQRLEPLLLAEGLLFLILAAPMLDSGPWSTVCWSVQAAVMLWAGLRLHHRWLCYGALALLLLAVGKFVAYDV